MRSISSLGSRSTGQTRISFSSSLRLSSIQKADGADLNEKRYEPSTERTPQNQIIRMPYIRSWSTRRESRSRMRSNQSHDTIKMVDEPVHWPPETRERSASELASMNGKHSRPQETVIGYETCLRAGLGPGHQASFSQGFGSRFPTALRRTPHAARAARPVGKHDTVAITRSQAHEVLRAFPVTSRSLRPLTQRSTAAALCVPDPSVSLEAKNKDYKPID